MDCKIFAIFSVLFEIKLLKVSYAKFWKKVKFQESAGLSTAQSTDWAVDKPAEHAPAINEAVYLAHVI